MPKSQSKSVEAVRWSGQEHSVVSAQIPPKADAKMELDEMGQGGGGGLLCCCVAMKKKRDRKQV